LTTRIIHDIVTIGNKNKPRKSKGLTNWEEEEEEEEED